MSKSLWKDSQEARPVTWASPISRKVRAWKEAQRSLMMLHFHKAQLSRNNHNDLSNLCLGLHHLCEGTGWSYKKLSRWHVASLPYCTISCTGQGYFLINKTRYIFDKNAVMSRSPHSPPHCCITTGGQHKVCINLQHKNKILSVFKSLDISQSHSNITHFHNMVFLSETGLLKIS